VLVVWDNRGYAQIRESFDDAAAPRMGVDVSSADPIGIARGFGWQTVEVDTPGEFATALSNAFEQGGPQFVRLVVPV
jgi:acetolactate synthase-1/2/3 large subunit